jgi:hypothetical protein
MGNALRASLGEYMSLGDVILVNQICSNPSNPRWSVCPSNWIGGPSPSASFIPFTAPTDVHVMTSGRIPEACIKYLHAPTSKDPFAPPPLRAIPVDRNRPGTSLMREAMAASWRLAVTSSPTVPSVAPVAWPVVPVAEVGDVAAVGELERCAEADRDPRVLLVPLVAAAGAAGLAAAWRPAGCSWLAEAGPV